MTAVEITATLRAFGRLGPTGSELLALVSLVRERPEAAPEAILTEWLLSICGEGNGDAS